MSANQYSPKLWTPELNKWLIDNTKGLPRQVAYEKLCENFPELHLTLMAVSNQRSRLRCSEYTLHHPSTKRKPLYAEQEKSGYINIKVAQPSVWWPKSKWVYVATHPEEAGDILETDAFYFADGDRRNFDWQNILLVHRREQTLFLAFGGVVPGNPELTRIHLVQARLKILQLDAGEKIGAVVKTKSSRQFREIRNRKAREYYRHKYHNDEAYRDKIRNYAKEYRKHFTPEQLEARRESSRKHARKKRAAENKDENETM